MRFGLVAAALFAILLAPPALPGTLVASRSIRAQEVLVAADLLVAPGLKPGALRTPEEAIGLEARINIYAGRPIRAEDLSAPAILERNQPVRLVYTRGRLRLETEGRAMDRAGVGESVRVMNLESRAMIVGLVTAAGTVEVTR